MSARLPALCLNEGDKMNSQLILALRTGVLALLVPVCALLTVPEPAVADPEPAAQSESAKADNIVLEKLRSASGDPATLNSILEKLIGTWHQSPDNFSEEGKAWMRENGITDFYDTFSWGTDKAWIDFGDYRVVNGVAKKTGTGMLSWHTGFKHLRFREAGSRGGFVDGMLEIKDDNTFIRHFEFFAPDGKVSYQSDIWTFDPMNPDCFSWQSTIYGDGEPTAYPARQFCKSDPEP